MTPPKPTAEELEAYFAGVSDMETETHEAILNDIDDGPDGWSVPL